MIFSDIGKAISQLTDPRLRGVLLKAVLLSSALLGPFVLGATVFVHFFLPDQLTLPWIGPVTIMNGLISGLSLVVFLTLSVFLMIPVATVIVSFLLDGVVSAVERRHYSDLAPVRPTPLWVAMIGSMRFLMLLMLVNFIALMIYLTSALLAPVIFWLVNGFMLGREYFQLVAERRLGRRDAAALRRRYGVQIWVAGILMAVPLSLPVVNLFVPVVGVAAFTHLFHRLNRDSASID